MKATAWIERLAAEGAMVLSAQSLRDFYAVRRRQDPTPEGRSAARNDVNSLWGHVPPALLGDLVENAWAIEDSYRLQFFDALLLASALAARCTIFLSEDLQAGQRIGALLIVNPFDTSPQDIFGA